MIAPLLYTLQMKENRMTDNSNKGLASADEETKEEVARKGGQA